MKKETTDLTGQRFQRYTVVMRVRHSERKIFYLCRCDCGKEVVVQKGNLVSGNSKSCGCLGVENLIASQTKHGHSTGRKITPEQSAWIKCRQRCNNPKNKAYADYGGRGIKVHPAFDDFATFLKEVGPRPSAEHSLNRIDNEGDYAPGNVTWSTNLEQMNNTRRNVRLELNGECLTITKWAERLGCRPSTICARIYNYHWPIEKALTVPVRTQNRKR